MRPIAMVVGASRRVGRETALRLARDGFDLVLTWNRDRSGAEETQAMAVDLGAKAESLRLNLDDRVAAVGAAGSLGLVKLDALIVSAGLWEKDSCDATAGEQAARFMRVNCGTPMELARALAPALRRSTLPGGASVMAFGDIHVDFRPMREYSRYLASKSALHSGMRELALELAPSIRVNLIVAGMIARPPSMSADELAEYVQRVPLARVGTPTDAATLVRFVTMEAPFMTGSAITLDGGRSLGSELPLVPASVPAFVPESVSASKRSAPKK